jgi:hypothetical protein
MLRNFKFCDSICVCLSFFEHIRTFEGHLQRSTDGQVRQFGIAGRLATRMLGGPNQRPTIFLAKTSITLLERQKATFDIRICFPANPS